MWSVLSHLPSWSQFFRSEKISLWLAFMCAESVSLTDILSTHGTRVASSPCTYCFWQPFVDAIVVETVWFIHLVEILFFLLEVVPSGPGLISDIHPHKGIKLLILKVPDPLPVVEGIDIKLQSVLLFEAVSFFLFPANFPKSIFDTLCSMWMPDQ